MHFSKDQNNLDLSYLAPEIFLLGSSCKKRYIYISQFLPVNHLQLPVTNVRLTVSDFRINNASTDSVVWRCMACHSNNNILKVKILLSILHYTLEKLHNSTKHTNQGEWVCTISIGITVSTMKTIFLSKYLCTLMH